MWPSVLHAKFPVSVNVIFLGIPKSRIILIPVFFVYFRNVTLFLDFYLLTDPVYL